MRFASPVEAMQRALAIAQTARGSVEPNPLVGAVIVNRDLELLGEGFHGVFGGPHAEVEALRNAGPLPHDAILYVTLEPCAHHGKTPPCTEAILKAGLRKVVIASRDPAEHGAGSGVDRLRAAGVEVETGLCQAEGDLLIRPFAKVKRTGLPYVHAKWAMSLDGKIATRTGHSQWISGPESRQKVHELRGVMDAIVVGRETMQQDDPLLTARPPGKRIPRRVVFDSQASVPLDSKLVQSIAEAPLTVICAEAADEDRIQQLTAAGADVIPCKVNPSGHPDLTAALAELATRGVTHLFCEGGGTLLGTFYDENLIDEFHLFLAPKLIGGIEAPSPLAGQGRDRVPDAGQLEQMTVEQLGSDLYVHGYFRADQNGTST